MTTYDPTICPACEDLSADQRNEKVHARFDARVGGNVWESHWRLPEVVEPFDDEYHPKVDAWLPK